MTNTKRFTIEPIFNLYCITDHADAEQPKRPPFARDAENLQHYCDLLNALHEAALAASGETV